ncbi:MAG: MarR family winged helix-turn-helix transcriptional regulator [Actinomycetota bacterium]|nr:MarR family winged helix-turn-helix transcriptional regulator [Actinomycetota bacterium]
MPSASDTRLSQEDLVRLRMALGRLGRVLRQHVDADLPYALASLVLVIGRTEPTTASLLAEAEGVSAPSVSRSLNRLVALGLVSREVDQADGRVHRLRLTEAGRRIRDNVLMARHDWLVTQSQRLSPTDLAKLLNAVPALERLCDPEPS